MSKLGAGEQRDGMARWAGLAAVVGTVFLLVYFTVPALSGWPFAGGTPTALANYASDHALLFFAGGWFQTVGSALCVAFVLAVLRMAGTVVSFAGLLAMVGGATLLAVVLAEAVVLESVPVAAASGDSTTAAVAFALSNGVFVRIFPLIPAPMVFVGVGFAGRGVLGGWLARSAIVLAGAFVLAGALAVVTPVGVFVGIGLSVMQAVWFLAAGLRMLLRRGN
ncbi:hypothetical protein [Sinomonas sp. G460-2]|uniref:hypothetical protein n=1 Tax=Sinomonas sp. G460-2 TaxID=3393464 RepID=UPI0039EF9EEC